MQDPRCQDPRFVPFGFLVTRCFGRSRFTKSAKKFRAILAVALTLMLLAPEPSVAQVQTYSCANGFGPVGAAPGAPVALVLPALLMQSLKTAPNPVLPNGTGGLVRDDLLDFIANQQAAIQLGKAFFWEMQAGSDSKTACATCHFKAGQDGRDRNQMNPGANGNWDGSGYGPNYALIANDFPLTVLPTKDIDNIIGSQGVRMSQFAGFSKSGAEMTTSVADPVFSVSGVNVRQVTGKNAPSTINAVFNHRNFFNGRAQPEFNGVNPFGNRDTLAKVWALGSSGSPVQIDIHIQNASLASQAVGPALSTVEMSASGRTFPDLGHKLLLLKPLGLQKVDSTDSVLGSLADVSAGKGLTTTYTALIQKAFQPKWWNSKKSVIASNGKSYSMMEANFSLFWGLAIMYYEATLVSDATPMDQYLQTRVFSTFLFDPLTGMPSLLSDNPSLLDQVVNRLAADGISVTRTDILNGLNLFERPVAPPPSYPVPSGFGVGCIGCHVGAETTSASVRNLTGPGIEAGDAALKLAGFDLRMERMFLKSDWNPPGPLTPVPLGTDQITFDPNTYAVNVTEQIIPYPGGFATPVSPISLPIATYDAGWYNLGVRPTADDVGLGGGDLYGSPLSWTQLFQQSTPGLIKVPGNGLGCAGAGNATFPNTLLNPLGFPLLSGPLLAGENTDVAGTFKVASLRNVEFNGPYFHNGGKATLAQVLEFYDGGGDFDRTTNATKAPAIVPLQLDAGQQKSLVTFLLALTDDRVRLQQAPFDHPQLFVPNGDNPIGADNTIEVPAVGAAGSVTPLQRFLSLNPFAL